MQTTSFADSGQEWVEGTVHPTGGYDSIREVDNGLGLARNHYRDGVWHRLDGPAVETNLGDGRVQAEWCIEGELHRLLGPAVRVYYPDDESETDLLYFLRSEEFGSEDEALTEFVTWPEEEIRTYLAWTDFAVLLDEGHAPIDVAQGLADGLRTLDGIRAVLGGAPVDWALAFERGGAS